MHIYLVRHTVYSNPEKVFAFHLPFTLSEQGRKDAEGIGKWFKNNNLTQLPIFTSPIVRTVQTAEIIAAQTQSSVTTDNRLIEVLCPGLQGTKEPAENSWVLEEYHPSRESKSSSMERTMSILNEKIAEGKDCILVAHGEGLTLLYYHLQNKELPQYLWDPANIQNVIQKGDVLELEITDSIVTGFRKVVQQSK